MQFHLSVCQQARRESDSFCLYLASARERLSWTFIKSITTPLPNIWLLLPNITHQAWIKTCTYCIWPVHSPKPLTSHLPHKQRVTLCVHLHRLYAKLFWPWNVKSPHRCFLYLFVESINDGLDPFHGLVRRHAQADARAAMSPINHFCDPDSCSRFAPGATNTP